QVQNKGDEDRQAQCRSQKSFHRLLHMVCSPCQTLPPAMPFAISCPARIPPLLAHSQQAREEHEVAGERMSFTIKPVPDQSAPQGNSEFLHDFCLPAIPGDLPAPMAVGKVRNMGAQCGVVSFHTAFFTAPAGAHALNEGLDVKVR